ncbi:MAG TPA: hypothetical protein VK892_18370 [Pyrinomonadaceae bacterium]|nr:hypothetical protein [Pyrinomonadaceae bacterium]
MNIQTRNHGENQVIISTKDLQKLVEIAEKVEPIKIIEELSAEELEAKEEAFAKKLLAEGFISNIPPRDESDEDDDFEPIEFEGEPLSEMIIRERR